MHVTKGSGSSPSDINTCQKEEVLFFPGRPEDVLDIKSLEELRWLPE